MPCDKCNLPSASKVNCLMGTGSCESGLMFVGEPPVEAEEIAGVALSGIRGEIVTKLLYHAELARHQCYLTHLVKCRCTNKDDSWKSRDGMEHFSDNKPSFLQAYTCGNAHLEDEISRVKPKVILPMGDMAFDYIRGRHQLNSDGTMVSNDKGDPSIVSRVEIFNNALFHQTYDEKRQAYIVPIYGPSYLSINIDAFTMMGEIVRKARKLVQQGPGIEETQCYVATSFDDANGLLDRALQFNLVSYDLETDGLDFRFGEILNLGLSWKEGTGVSLRFVDNTGASLYSPEQKAALLVKVRQLFQDPNRTMIGYNEAFDAAWPEVRWGIRVTCPRHDVQQIYHTLNSTAKAGGEEGKGFQSLEILSWLYTDMKNFKSETAPWFAKKKFLECPIDVLSRRNCADADATLRLYNRFMPKLKAHAAYGHYEKTLKNLPEMAKVLHVTGAAVSLPTLKSMSEKLVLASADLAREFCHLAGVDACNLKSSTQLGKVLFGKLGLPILSRTAKGQPQTTEYVLQELSKRTPILKPLMDYKKLEKLRGTYVLGLRGCALFGNSKKRKPDLWSVQDAIAQGFNTDGRVHASFSMIGTVTGRPSVSHPNLANQPRPTAQQKTLGVVIRQAFAPDEGWLLEGDLSQAELRVLAGVSGDQALMDAVNSKEGVHRRTAAWLYHLSLEQITDDRKSSAKTIVFAIAYGGTGYTIEEQIPEVLDDELRRRFSDKAIADNPSYSPEEIRKAVEKYHPTREERIALAENFILEWRAQYPRAGAWIDATKDFVVKNGFVQSVFGRVFQFPLAFCDNWRVQSACQRAAVNYCIQSAAVDVTYAAGWRVLKEVERLGLKSKFTNFVYDALFFEVPDDELDFMKTLVKTEMERPVPELPINIVAEIEVGRCWQEEHEPVLEENEDEDASDDEGGGDGAD